MKPPTTRNRILLAAVAAIAPPLFFGTLAWLAATGRLFVAIGALALIGLWITIGRVIYLVLRGD